MAASTCSKCGHHSFEIKETELTGARYKMFLVQCSKCGTPVGVMDYYNIGTKIGELEKEVKERFSSIEANQQNIYLLLQNILNKIR